MSWNVKVVRVRKRSDWYMWFVKHAKHRILWSIRCIFNAVGNTQQNYHELTLNVWANLPPPVDRPDDRFGPTKRSIVL